MSYDSICISSGHGKYVRGAAGSPVPPQLDEVDEARRVVDRVAAELRQRGVEVDVFHDDTSHDQNTNLNTIVNHHNANHARQLDVSVHFNAFDGNAHGTEVLYVTQEALAEELSNAISEAGQFTNRGPKYRSDLFFLNNTAKPAVLIETCFCDNTSDSQKYRDHFNAICSAIAAELAGTDTAPIEPPDHVEPPDDLHRINIPDNQRNITASMFGGEDDYNTSAYDESVVLNDTDFYVALPDRFEGERPDVLVINRKTGEAAIASIEDVGPWNIDDPYWLTGKRPQAESGTDMSGRKTNGAGIDLSPALAAQLAIDGMGEVDWDFIED